MDKAHQGVLPVRPEASIRTLFQSRSDLWYLGLACPQIWLTNMFQALNESAPLSTEIFYATRGLFLLAIAAIFFVRKYSMSVTWSALSWWIAGLMTIAPFLAYFAPPGYEETLAIVASVFGGMGIVWSYLPHIYVYSKLEPKQIAGYVLLSFALASLIRFPIGHLPFEIALVITMPLPVLGIIMGKKALERTSSQPGHTKRKAPSENLRKLVPVAVELAIYGIVVGMVRISSEGSQYEWIPSTVHLVFRTVFPLLLLWWIFTRNRSISISRLCQIALLCVITALLAMSLFGSPTSPLSVAAATSARTAIIILLWLVLALVARRSSLHPYIVFGVGWSLYMLSIVVGMVIGEAVEASTVFTDSFTLNLVYFLVVSTVFILLLRNEGASKLFPTTEDKQLLTGDLDSLDSRCMALGEEYRLTKREVEVMQLICKGRSKSHIAQMLSISEHTVRGYAKNLYAKLGVHSKQELLNLIGIV